MGLDSEFKQRAFFEANGGLSRALEVALDNDNQQRPLDKHHGDIKELLKGLVSYYRLTNKRVNGWTYGSDKVHENPRGRAALAAVIREQYHIRFGYSLFSRHPDLTDDRITWAWRNTRKVNNKILRDGWAIDSEYGRTELGKYAVAVVYCYAGIAGGKHGLIKLGYTNEVLDRYLQNNQLSHMPRLLAHMIGNKDVEQDHLAKCKADCVVGNEWHQPSDRLYSYIRTTFSDLVPDFDRVWNQAHYEYYGRVG
jgi:hypothetical protein